MEIDNKTKSVERRWGVSFTSASHRVSLVQTLRLSYVHGASSSLTPAIKSFETASEAPERGEGKKAAKEDITEIKEFKEINAKLRYQGDLRAEKSKICFHLLLSSSIFQ